MTTPSASSTDPSRVTKLAKFFNAIISGAQSLKTPKNGDLFLEALCDQPDAPTCIEKIISSQAGLSSIQTCLRFNASASFQNGPATALLRYVQCPSLKIIHGGNFLHRVILHVVEPPFFWNPFLLSFRNGLLNTEAQQCFGFLLSELLCLPSKGGAPYLPIAQEASIQTSFLNSTSYELRTIGQKIKHIVSAFYSDGEEASECGPGGRHDNDFVDFREIAIHPTADELLSEEQPFLRVARSIDSPENEEKRLGHHLDNQFRLLREDMLSELREELQIVFGKRKGRHRGIVVDGFTLLDVACGDHQKPLLWGLRLQCTSDLPQLANVKPKGPKERRDLLIQNRNIFKHQSLVCLILDGEIVSFPIIRREVDDLAQKLPVVTLQFTGKANTSKALLRLKTAKRIKLVQIDTAVFAFEPVLKGLQELRNMPLADELLFWKSDSPMSLPSYAPMALIEKIERKPTRDLSSIFDSTKSIRLDDSQTASLLSGLKQKVSLIQGPPGKKGLWLRLDDV